MRICEIFEMDHINKGEEIKLNDCTKKSVFFLKKGTIKIVDTNNSFVKYLVKRGNLFGELALFEDKNNGNEIAYALEDSIVCYIDSKQMLTLMDEHKSLKNGVLKIYGNRIKRLERKLSDLLYKDSATRIEDFIIDYLKEFGEEEDQKYIAKNLLSHKEIANLTNTSRQTVSNVLSNLRKEGVIDYNTKTISCLKIDSAIVQDK